MRLSGPYQLALDHPVKFIRNSTLKFAAREDWKKAARIQREGCTLVPLPIERWQWEPDVATIGEWIATYIWQPGSVTAIDFEGTVEGQPVCLGLWNAETPLETSGICIPYLCQGGAQYWNARDRRTIDGWVREFLESPRWLKTGQNIVGYDTGEYPWNTRSLIKRAWGIDVAGLEIDTFPLHHICFSELRHSLDFQASCVTDLSRYKQELHEHDDEEEEDDAEDDWKRVLEKPDEELRTYCLKDCFSQAMARLSLLAECEVLG
jgi:hypothetical protein